MNIILFGPPGAGKGTQAHNIAEKYNLYQISTGDLLRNEIKNKTETGEKIEKIISQGSFVTDEIVEKLIVKTITKDLYREKIIFDGYPRNINQAKNLDKLLKTDNQFINFVFFLNVSREIIQKRILGRRICVKCNKTFNEYLNKKEIENHECDKKNLIKRNDDNDQTVIRRYDEYTKQTKPVLDFYSSRSYFHEIDGGQKIHEISKKIDQILAV